MQKIQLQWQVCCLSSRLMSKEDYIFWVIHDLKKSLKKKVFMNSYSMNAVLRRLCIQLSTWISMNLFGLKWQSINNFRHVAIELIQRTSAISSWIEPHRQQNKKKERDEGEAEKTKKNIFLFSYFILSNFLHPIVDITNDKCAWLFNFISIIKFFHYSY